MAEERLDFSSGRERPPGAGTGRAGLALGLVVVALILAFTRGLWTPTTPPGIVVEVTGEVPRPGRYLVDPPTTRAALRAAGTDAGDLPDHPLVEGDRVELFGGRVRVLPPTDPVLVGLPIDVNTADATALAAIPGVSEQRAMAIVAEREVGGPFRGLEDLTRVPGLGASMLEELRPFVVASEAPPVDLATATAAQLERLPGIGPKLAARIVEDRAEHGPCRSPRELLRVAGVGEDLLADLEGRVVCRRE